MKVRDLPRELLLAYSATIIEVGLPAAWIDMDFITFLYWLDAARKDVEGTKERWNLFTSLQYEAAALILPVIEKCPSLSMEEAVEILPPAERSRCATLLRELAGR